ncbi:MAG: adenylyltransferase/cytidyltransferase family protein [Synechococcales cyanobacterium]
MQPRLSSKTVFVSGNFNVLHPGHLRLLRFAKECGDRLIVAVQSDRMAGKGAHVTEHYDGGIFLRHSQGLTGDVFIYY